MTAHSAASLRATLDARDEIRLAHLIDADPGLVDRPMSGLRDHPLGLVPLTYLALLPYDVERGVRRRVTGTVALARRLVTAIARPDGVRRLLALGADPRARDGRSETALEACRREAVRRPDEPGYAEVAALLAARAC